MMNHAEGPRSKHFRYPRLHLLLKQEDLKAHHLELQLIDRKRTVTRLHKGIIAPEYVFHSSRLRKDRDFLDVFGDFGQQFKAIYNPCFFDRCFMSSGFAQICLSVFFVEVFASKEVELKQ